MSDSISQPTSWRRRGRAATTVLLALALVAAAAGGLATVRANSDAAPRQATVLPNPTPVSSYSAIVETVSPAVVTVRVDRRVEAMPTSIPAPFRDFFGAPDEDAQPRREGGIGSGVIIRSDGYILTNHHVVFGSERVRVDMADGRSLTATVVGSDRASDLAVLKVTASGLPVVPFGDSDAAKVGDVVLAFGNPLGVGQTVTMGIVSAKGRSTGASEGAYEDFLQTDAPINRGNSGGALVNVRGQLIGINAQILSPSGGNIGLGFAIPASMAQSVANQLIAGGVVHRAKLGVTAQAISPDLAASLGLSDGRGALVSQIEPESPAETAGLRTGDVITSIDGRPVTDAQSLRNTVAAMRPGARATLEYLRRGERKSTTAHLIERDTVKRADASSTPNRSEAPRFGLGVEPMTAEAARSLGLPPGTMGMLVTEVLPDGPAAEAGLQPGDVITQVNGRTPTSVASLRQGLTVSGETPALVLVNRRGTQIFVALRSQRS